MTYFIIFIAVVILGFFILKASSRGTDEYGKAIYIMNFDTAKYLNNIYKEDYNDEESLKLSAAVTNELFSHHSANDPGNPYYMQNKNLVENKLAEVKDDKYLCKIISVAGQLIYSIAAIKKQMTPEIIQWAKKLSDIGIFLPDEEFKFPKSRDQLRAVVGEFHERVKAMT